MGIQGQCYQCQHWNGDKEKAQREFDKNPVSLDLENGWPDSGRCRVLYTWGNIEIYGDASYTFEVDANFGCIRFDYDLDAAT